MSFNEKLQKLRKQNSLSQEKLADLLDVTRQSVSKWESGTTYPEMDKLLSMCKIFKCSLEDLTNDEIVDIKVDDKKKSYIYTFIDSILEFMKETIRLLKTMNKKELESCFITMGITAIILLLLHFPVIHVQRLLDQIVVATSNHFLKFTYQTIDLIIRCSYWSLFFVIFVYIFKTNFLNNPKYKKKEEIQRQEERIPLEEDESAQEKGVKEEIKVPIKRTVNHIDTLFRILEHTVMFFLKTLVCMIILPILVLLFFLCAGFLITVYLLFKGVFYFSILLGIPFAIVFVLTILEILICFVIKRRTSEKRLMITFLASVIGLGTSFGIFLLDFSTIQFLDEEPKMEQKVEQIEYEMTDDLYFLYSSIVEYKVDNLLQTTVKVEGTYYADYIELSLDQKSSIPYYEKSDMTLKLIPSLINDLAKRKIHDYTKLNDVQITIYTSEENIAKLKQNYMHEMDEMDKREEQDMLQSSYYERQNGQLREEMTRLENTNQELNQQLYDLHLQIKEYQYKINQLKEILESLHLGDS